MILTIDSILLVWILWSVRSVVSQLTKEQICAEPTFDGGLGISHSKNVSDTKRYLFRGEYVMPYDWDQQQIEWQNIVPISDMFKNSPQNIAGVRYATAANDKTYLSFIGDENTIFEFTSNGKDYSKSGTISLGSAGFEFLVWNIRTAFPSKTVVEKTMYFFDSTPQKSGSAKVDDFKYTQGSSSSTMRMQHNMNRTRVTFYPEIFPNTMIYKNMADISIKIPVEFDAYYQTKTKETVFFKGESACVSLPTLPSPNESPYCHIFVDTRTLIGCFTTPVSAGSGPEVLPDEPADNDPDF